MSGGLFSVKPGVRGVAAEFYKQKLQIIIMTLRRWLLLLICIEFTICIQAQQKKLFNYDWEFVKDLDTVFSQRLLSKDSQVKWQNISLPHTANVEPIVKAAQQWQGISFYRKFFSFPLSHKGKHVAIQFDAAMQEADVYLNVNIYSIIKAATCLFVSIFLNG